MKPMRQVNSCTIKERRPSPEVHRLCHVCRCTLVSGAEPVLLALAVINFAWRGLGPRLEERLRPPSSTSPPPRLVVRTLENRTFEPNLETRYTNYLRHEFSSGSGAQIVADSEAADLGAVRANPLS